MALLTKGSQWKNKIQRNGREIFRTGAAEPNVSALLFHAFFFLSNLSTYITHNATASQFSLQQRC